MASANEEFSTTIGQDAVFKGELRFEKGLQLLGRIEGEVTSDGSLVIGEGAKLVGDAKAGTIRLDGDVKGNLNANTKVQLSASARLEGDLQTARLEVAEGAVLVGRCAIGVNGASSSTASSASAPKTTPSTSTSTTSTSTPAPTPPAKGKADEGRRR